MPFATYWRKCLETGTAAPLETYSLAAAAARQGRFMRPVRQPGSPLETITYALHLDAGLFASLLREHAQARGVIRTEGKVRGVALKAESGFIESITLESGERIEADLYIDCSGFRGVLIEGALETGYEDWTRWLPCDRAVAAGCERSGPLSSHTLARAREVGWQWRIPLQHRVGNGYVYSSQLMKDDEARDLLLSSLEGRALREPLRLTFTTGRRRLSWNRNCVAIGLSAGFLEPLESTGIHLIQRGIFLLLTFFPDRQFRQPDIDRYNRQLAFDYEGARDFLIAHYRLTERAGQFWQQCRETDMPASLKERLELFRSHGRILRDDREIFTVQGWQAILAGQDVRPEGYDPMADSLSAEQAQRAVEEVRRVIAHCAAAMPAHQDFIAQHCAAPAS